MRMRDNLKKMLAGLLASISVLSSIPVNAIDVNIPSSVDVSTEKAFINR